MPRAPRPCLGPTGTGCPTASLATQGDNRCPQCRQTYDRTHDKRRPSYRQRGYDTRWDLTRKAHLRLEPQCTQPGCTEPATDVDHIDGKGPNGPRGHDHANLRSLCHPHHSQRTARDQPGGWHAT